MHVELINTGSELILGRVLNTHQQWLCRELADAGYLVSRQLAVPDAGADIQQALQESLTRSDLVIVTGGLGPTSDDVTRTFIAQLLGKGLHEDPAIIEHIRGFFQARGRPMPDSTRIQAQVPDGALVLPNPHGTAPGLAMEVRPNPFRPDRAPSWIFMLPGPPRELRPMYEASVVPLLQRVLPPPALCVCRTLRSSGIGESLVEERIATDLQSLMGKGLQVGYCARPGQVDVRFVAQGAAARELVDEACAWVRTRLGRHVYGEEDDEIESALVSELTRRGETLSLAESCTGGLLAHRITNVPGASAVLMAGMVTYSNESKQSLLGVRSETLAQHGAVSEAVVREMVEGARHRTGTTYAVGVTGIAGPGGGSQEKPVGTVHIGLAAPSGTTAIRRHNPFDRETFKNVTAQQAMELLWRELAVAHRKE
jgi:nicotinamide-nucleotide amidase